MSIVSIDIAASYLPLFAAERVCVDLLIVDNKDLAQKCQRDYAETIRRCYWRQPETNAEYAELNRSDYDLTYEEMEAYRPIQLKVEHFLSRELSDQSCIEDRYYTALRFFLGYFANNHVDLVFCANLEHGGVWDSLILEIAKRHDVPAYVLNFCTSSGLQTINVVTKYNDRSLIDLSGVKRSRIDLSSYFKSLEGFVSTLRPQWTLRTCFGWLGFNRRYTASEIFDLFGFLRRRDDRFIHQCVIPRREILLKSDYVSLLRVYYGKCSVVPDMNRKFIYYPLHQDPEAATQARTTLSAQLHIVRMLKECLPTGWKLYVKEHPAQFGSYRQAPYFYRNVERFRSLDFYRQVANMEDVHLVDMSVPSGRLVSGACAVASIFSTCLLEGIAARKPVICFGRGAHFIEKMRDVHCVDGYRSLREAIAAIESGSAPDYSDLPQVLDRYAFGSKMIWGAETMLGEDDVVAVIRKILTRP